MRHQKCVQYFNERANRDEEPFFWLKNYNLIIPNPFKKTSAIAKGAINLIMNK